MSHVIASLMMMLLLSLSAYAETARASYNAILAQETQNRVAAFAAMVRLAETGFAPAANRVGFYHRYGLGTPKDLLAAKRWYQRATQRDHPWAFASLARVELALGQTQSALNLLQTAARDGRPGTARLLATSHIDKAFGSESDAWLGKHILISLAKEGDAEAARDLLVRYNWNRVSRRVPAAIVAQVVQAGLEGDARFADAALVHLLRQPGKTGSNLETRVALMQVSGLNRRTLLTARVRLAADMQPERFWIDTEAILKDTEPEHFGHIARTAFWINKNAWVRVLQKELRTRGYYKGPLNAKMTAQTIRAQNQFCRDQRISPQCAVGPLKGRTVYEVANALANAGR